MQCLRFEAVVREMGKGSARELGPGFGRSLPAHGAGVACVCPKALYSYPGWAEERAAYSSSTGNGHGGCRGLWKPSHITLSSECPSATALQCQDNAVGPVGLWSQKEESPAPPPSSATYLPCSLQQITYVF